MQFTTGLVTLALAIAGASAAPNAAIEERQTPGLVYVKFYGKGGCQGDFIEDTVYFDDGTGVCKIETFQGPYLSWAVESNEALRPRKFLTQPPKQLFLVN